MRRLSAPVPAAVVMADDDDVLDDADRCLLRDSALLALSRPDAAGYLYRRASISGWYRYWFSLHGSQLNYHDPTPSGRRGPLAGSISLFRNTVTVAATPKRPRELDLVDFSGKAHALRAETDAQLHWWLQVFAIARNKIPPAKPFAPPTPTAAPPLAPPPTPSAAAAAGRPSPRSQATIDEAGAASSRAASASAAAADAFSSAAASASVRPEPVAAAAAAATPPPLLPTRSIAVEDHLPVDHVLCVVHGIGVDEETLADNVKLLQESYGDMASKIFPDLNFRVEILVVRWRNALTQLDVHRKLQAVVPIAPTLSGESNPLRQFMVHRIIDYVYYTHDRYRRHIMREIVSQLNANMAEFRSRRPDFDGPVSVFAHSLGAALCYDLLARRASDDQALLASEGMRIDFDVANLFMAGSPLGTFLHLDPGLALGANIRSLPFRVYNIFHPNDPIGTRLEPYVEPRFVGVRPIVVPYWLNMGIRSSTAQWLGNLWSGGGVKKPRAAAAAAAAAAATAATATPTAGAGAKEPDAGSAEAKEAVNGDGAAAGRPLSFQMQPSTARVGIGTGSETAAALAASIGGDAGGVEAFSGVVGGKGNDDGVPVAYFPEAVQDEVVASTYMPHRLDFALQLSSTMEEVSTSWSALRAHTDYWSNRDMMLLISSSMVKTTHGIPDNVSRLPSLEVDQHVIDSRVGVKSTRFGSGWEADSDELLDDLAASDGRTSRSNGQGVRNGGASFESGVGEFVAKLVDESAAMHELMLQHPNVRIRQGGITRSTSKGVGDGGKPPKSNASSYAGWTSYLPWFGRDASSDSLYGSGGGDGRGGSGGTNGNGTSNRTSRPTPDTWATKSASSDN